MSNSLPLIVRHALANTGWGESEITVYSILIEKGKMGITSLSEATSIPVSSLQHTLKKLLAKRMIQKKTINSKPVYIAKGPKELHQWMNDYAKQAQYFESAVGKFVEQYDFHPDVHTPKVQQFEGKKGVVDSYRKVLKLCKTNEIHSFFSTPPYVDPELKEFLVSEYIEGRKELGIHNKNIAVKGDIAKEYSQNPQRYLSETQLIQIDPNTLRDLSNTEINVFDNHVHYMTFDQSKSFGLIIEDRILSSLLQLLFHLLWQLNTKVTIFGPKNLLDSYTELFTDRSTNEVFTISSLAPSKNKTLAKLHQAKAKVIKDQELNHKEITPNLGQTQIELTIHGPKIHILNLTPDDEPQIYLLHEPGLAQVLSLIQDQKN